MKRVFRMSAALVLALVITLGMTSAAFATSMSDVVSVSASDGVELKVGSVESGIPPLTEEIAAQEIDGKNASDLTVLWQREVSASKLPATLTFSIAGVDDDQEVYLFHYAYGKWNLEASGKGKSISKSFDSLSPLGVVAAKKAGNAPAADKDAKTPTTSKDVKTGDSSSAKLWGTVMVIAAAGAVGLTVYSKKRRVNW